MREPGKQHTRDEGVRTQEQEGAAGVVIVRKCCTQTESEKPLDRNVVSLATWEALPVLGHLAAECRPAAVD